MKREIALKRYAKKRKKLTKMSRQEEDMKIWENIGNYRQTKHKEFEDVLKNTKENYLHDLETEIFDDGEFESIESIHEKRFKHIKKLKNDENGVN